MQESECEMSRLVGKVHKKSSEEWRMLMKMMENIDKVNAACYAYTKS